MAIAQVQVPEDWPKVDLPAHNLTEIQIVWIVSDVDRFRSVFSDMIDGIEGLEEKRGGLVNVVSYRRSKTEHRRLQFFGWPIGADDCIYMLSYDASGNWPQSPIPDSLRPEPEFLSRVLALQIPGPCSIRAEFEFPEGDEYETVFPLPFPMDPPEGLSWPIDELYGIRGVKHDSDTPGHRFTLDLRPDGSIWLLLRFEFNADPASFAPSQAVEAAAQIAKEFVSKRKA